MSTVNFVTLIIITASQLLVTVASFVLAYYNRAMVVAATRSADMSRSANALADVHQQESLMPILTLLGTITVVAVPDRGPRCVFSGRLQNAGHGPAVKVRACVELAGQVHEFPIAPVQAQFTDPDFVLPSMDPVDLSSAEGVQTSVPFKMVLDYENIFGASAQTQHANPGLSVRHTTTDIQFPKVVERTLPS